MSQAWPRARTVAWNIRPRRDTRFQGGDQAYLIGPYEQLLQVLRSDQQT
jgi:hypothetical protein